MTKFLTANAKAIHAFISAEAAAFIPLIVSGHITGWAALAAALGPIAVSGGVYKLTNKTQETA